jgi:cellulose biosynthesis protein BcsQ
MKLISVWGSPGGGKTTISLELAKFISQTTEKNVVLIFTEDQADPLTYLFPKLDQEGGSLGHIVATAGFNQEAIKKTLVNHKKNKNLAFLGYRDGESKRRYPDMVESQVVDLFIALGPLFDYCIVDGQSNISNDLITQYALRYGEVVMLGGGDLKSIAFFKSISSQIQDYQGIRNARHAVNNPWDFESWLMVAEKYEEKVEYFFPYSIDLQLGYLEGTSINPLDHNRHNKELLDEIDELANQLMEIDSKNENIAVKKFNKRFKVSKRTKKEKAPKPQKEKKMGHLFSFGRNKIKEDLENE